MYQRVSVDGPYVEPVAKHLNLSNGVVQFSVDNQCKDYRSIYHLEQQSELPATCKCIYVLYIIYYTAI